MKRIRQTLLRWLGAGSQHERELEHDVAYWKAESEYWKERTVFWREQTWKSMGVSIVAFEDEEMVVVKGKGK